MWVKKNIPGKIEDNLNYFLKGEKTLGLKIMLSLLFLISLVEF